MKKRTFIQEVIMLGGLIGVSLSTASLPIKTRLLTLLFIVIIAINEYVMGLFDGEARFK